MVACLPYGFNDYLLLFHFYLLQVVEKASSVMSCHLLLKGEVLQCFVKYSVT